jgi:hypothetical protein
MTPSTLVEPPEAAAPETHARSAGERSDGERVDRSGTISLWALLGLVAVVITAQTWGRWIFSSHEFAAAPILGPDHISNTKLVTLRVVEVLSAFVFVALLWITVVRPWRRNGRVGLDGMLFVACFIGSITDGVLNIFHYLFAWNAHSVNLGSWSSFLPLRSGAAPSRYAEALVWGLPMYIYFVLGVGIAGCAMVKALRRRHPSISNTAALGAVFVVACLFDLVVENAIIRATDAYAFVQTPSQLTLWAGTLHQFPLYEMFCVAMLGVLFTALRLSALDDPAGVSFVERGAWRFRPSLQRPLRWLAIIGFTVTTLFCVYHVPFNWLGSNGHSIAPLPSYMQPGLDRAQHQTFPGAPLRATR